MVASTGTAGDKKETGTDKKATAGAGKGDTKGVQGHKHKGRILKITKVNPRKGTITVKMKDKAGKEQTKTFELTEDVRMLDSTGRVAELDVFRSGDEVLIIEAEGRLRELHKARKGGKTGNDKTGSR